MALDFRTQGVCGKIKQERRVFYGGKPGQADPGIGSGLNQHFELVMAECLESRTDLALHPLCTRCRPALQLIGGKDALLGLLPRAGLEKTFSNNEKQLRPQGGCGETKSVRCIASNQKE